MATSAFKSTSKRSTIGASGDSSSVKGSDASSNRSGVHRRSRSLNRFTGRLSDFSRTDVEESGDSSARFVNTVRGSSGFPEISLDDLASEFFPSSTDVEEGESARGRLVRRSSGVSPSEAGVVAAAVQRRGRSTSRHRAPAEKGFVDNGRRRQRSVSVARHQCNDSESGRDLSRTFVNHAKTKGLGNANIQDSLHKAPTSTPLPNQQRGLRRSMSQKDLPQLQDGYSSYSSALTDDEGHSARCNKSGNERTIRTVYSQKKTDHPTSDGVGSGLFEEMRKEVRHVVAEIRTELQQVLVKTEPIMLGNVDRLESKSTDVIEAITQIRKNYSTKLEQSEKRARDLLAELAIEEQRGREFSKIVRELLPEPKQSAEPVKPLRARKKSTDRIRMSKRLTEEADRYFEGFLSNVEDTEFSSFDGETSDASSSLGGNAGARDLVIDKAKLMSGRGRTSASPLHVETDGVVLPWLEWETSNDGTPLPGRNYLETPTTSHRKMKNIVSATGLFFLFSLCAASFSSDELLANDEEFGLEGGELPDLEYLHPIRSPIKKSSPSGDSKVQFALEHAFADSDFSSAGIFTARLKTLNHGGQTLTKLRLSRDNFTEREREIFKELLKEDEFYRIRIPSNVLNPPGKGYIISSVKARCLPRMELDEHFVIHMEGVNVLAVNYGSTGACQYPRTMKLPAKWSFNSYTVLKPGEQAPRTPTFAEEILGENGEGEGVKPPERSFWSKYWMYMIPLGLIIMNAFTQAMNMPPEEQAGGQPSSQQQLQGTQRASNPAVRRR